MSRPRAPHRRGTALLIVLTLLILVTVAISLAVRTNLTARRAARHEAVALQAESLANAGGELAATQLQASAAYAGEVWQVPAEELGGRDTAQVTIEVAADPVDASAKMITVVAEYPAGDSPLKHRHRLVRPWKPQATTESASP